VSQCPVRRPYPRPSDPRDLDIISLILKSSSTSFSHDRLLSCPLFQSWKNSLGILYQCTFVTVIYICFEVVLLHISFILSKCLLIFLLWIIMSMTTIHLFHLIPSPHQDHENKKWNDKPQGDYFPQVLEEQPAIKCRGRRNGKE
jgi:hypothetical protein